MEKADVKYQARLIEIVKEEKEKNATFNEKSPRFSIKNALKFLSPIFETFLLSLVIVITFSHSVIYPFLIGVVLICASTLYVACRYEKTIILLNAIREGEAEQQRIMKFN
ncbi:hypothetical protein C922_05440 [Plasmodium inui San Antonio 1]|uniref:Uncharacterized protein n=1 Tax=Plasmodium inui San Antonio 1 TaxID=1237626 RepID=W6ZXY0_9APIC|nr:hypothetical protein C922_05440 [Plasmodium inui San Antonio 1]EUD64173.1 hypothetical protein C922_05440 [Plasmodium inui San Antonio 1]